MRQIPLVIFFSMMTVGASLLSAQSPLTLAHARAGALAHSTTLRRADLAVDAAALAEKTQWYDFLPSISASVGADAGYPAASRTDSVQGTANLTVNQAIYDGGASALLTAIDALETKSARQEARVEYFSILEAVDLPYHAVQKTRASVDAANADLQAARGRLVLAAAKRDANMIAASDLQEAEATAASRETSLIQAEGALSVAEATLSSLTGLAVPSTLEDTDFEGQEEVLRRSAALTAKDIAAFIEAVQKAANANNPSLSQAALATQKAKQAIALARAGYVPTVNAAFTHTATLSPTQGLSPGSGSLSINATISLDLWTTNARVDAKSISARQAALDEEESKRTFALQVKGAVYDCLSAARSVVSSMKALEYSEANYQGILGRYKLSAASPADLIDAEALLSSSRTALISARYSFLDSFSALRTLAGLETEELLAALLP